MALPADQLGGCLTVFGDNFAQRCEKAHLEVIRMRSDSLQQHTLKARNIVEEDIGTLPAVRHPLSTADSWSRMF